MSEPKYPAWFTAGWGALLCAECATKPDSGAKLPLTQEMLDDPSLWLGCTACGKTLAQAPVTPEDEAYAKRLEGKTMDNPSSQRIANLRAVGMLTMMYGDPDAPPPRGILYGQSIVASAHKPKPKP